MGQASTHMTPTYPTLEPYCRCYPSPLSTGGCGGRLCLRQIKHLLIKQPELGRGSEQGFLPQGLGWATTSHSPGHSVMSTDEKVVDTHGRPPSTPPLLPSLAQPWICPAATGSDLVGFPSPEIKPNLAPQPPSPVTVLGVRV